MNYLLDVNALVAFGVSHHQFHGRVSHWMREQPGSTRLLTSSIVELGFVRTISQVPAYELNVREASALLSQIKEFWSFLFLADDRELRHLPNWVQSPKKLTDGHLLGLAQSHSALLATFDTGIPGAFLIP